MSPLENLLNEIVDEDKIRNSEIDFGIATFFTFGEKRKLLFYQRYTLRQTDRIPYGECVLSGI